MRILAHFGLFCPPIAGHLTAMACIGRTLSARGHKVTVFHTPEARARIEAEGLDFFSLSDDALRTGEIAEVIDNLSGKSGLDGMRFTIECARRTVELICRHVPAALHQTGVDMLLVDDNEPAAASVADHLRLPFVTVCAGLPLHREDLVLPPFVPWTYRTHWSAVWLNRAAYKLFDTLVSPVNRALNLYRKRWGLRPIRKPEDTFSLLAQICQITEDSDFPRVNKLQQLHHVGLLRSFVGSAKSRGSEEFPWGRLNGKPLVYLAFGTILSANDTPFQIIGEALASLDVQLVVGLGGRSVASLPALQGLPVVVQYAPQIESLKKASVFITHGGMNSVLESISCGTPMLAVPVTNDQPAVSARVRWSGAGTSIPVAQLSVPRVKSAITAIFSDPAYRLNAGKLQASMLALGGASRAADIVEDAYASWKLAEARSPRFA